MATITLPVQTRRTTYRVDFEIDELSFARSIARQGKGARKAWRRAFATLPETPQSHAVLEWNRERRLVKMGYAERVQSLRAMHRAWLPVEEQRPATFDVVREIQSRDEIRLHTDEQAAPGSDDD